MVNALTAAAAVLILVCTAVCASEGAREGVADLGGEACAVHLFEDNLRMFADFAPEGLEGDFEFDFGHSSLGFRPP